MRSANTSRTSSGSGTPSRARRKNNQVIWPPPTTTTNLPQPPPSTYSSAKLTQVFYRRAGLLMLHPKPVLLSPIDGEIQRLYFPALLALVLEPVQSLTDAVIVGRVGTPQLGALGIGTVAFQFVLGLFSVFIFATTTLVAEEENDSGRDVVGAPPTGDKTAIYKGTILAVAVGLVLQLAIANLSPMAMHAISSDPTVASLADDYVRSRACAAVPALVMMVGVGAGRGYKDMWTPLLGSLAYGVSLAVFDALFVWELHMGLRGAGYAAAISQWVGAATVMWSLSKNGNLRWADFASAKAVPTAESVSTYMRMAGPLALSGTAALAPVLLSSSIATRLGPDQLAAHTVLRQISLFWIQLFMGFNATAHSLVASSLGKRTAQGVLEASRIMERIAYVAVATSIPLAAGLYASRALLPLAFTDSPVVVDDVAGVLPLLLVFIPLDALSLGLEGSILGASDTGWIARRAVGSSALSVFALELLALGGTGCSLWSIWAALKLLNVSILGCDVARLAYPVRRRKG